MPKIKIALAQLNFMVGDIVGNADQIIDQCEQYQSQCDLLVFTELCLTAYPPEDLLLRNSFLKQVEQQIQRIQRTIDELEQQLAIVIGTPILEKGDLYNCAMVVSKNQSPIIYKKQKLPNYGVFDEKRYFQAGKSCSTFQLKGYKLGLSVCEDLWSPEVMQQNKQQGVEIIININASPYHLNKHHQRLESLKARVNETQIPIIYVNQVGGQDELLFDGYSKAINAFGDVVFQTGMKSKVGMVSFDSSDGLTSEETSDVDDNEMAQLYDALVLATQDYVRKNGFKGALLGLSGGIDSALVLAIATDALGADAIHAVMMPYQYTADISITDAELEAKALGVEYSNIAIHQPVNAFMDILSSEFEGTKKDTTEENIQARTRGVVLMALSNKTGKMLLTTGNKSEMSVGYATLYGDMAGGFAPLKDVSKLRVFALAKYRNTLSPVIPERVITRPPSAELSPDQKDEDSLPPYEILDAILEAYIEQHVSQQEIIEQGFDEEQVRQVVRLVNMNEYKRRQAPPGVKITERSFGKERRYPITSGFKG